jgi:hypothetical protein
MTHRFDRHVAAPRARLFCFWAVVPHRGIHGRSDGSTARACGSQPATHLVAAPAATTTMLIA